ncbi:MAG: ABC transporter permease [Betaproteobacteria bacterium]
MLRLELRTRVPATLVVLAPFVAVASTLLICAVLIVWAGAPVGRAYVLLFEGAFGSRFAISETLTRATPLMLTGLAAAVAFRAHFYNIGAEGQLYVGALAAVAVGGGAIVAPPIVLFPLMIAAGMAAGALLLLLPALAKTRLGVDEVVTTLLLNFIALLFVSMMLDGPMKDPLSMGWPQSVAIQPELEFGKLLERSRAHSGLIFAMVLAAVLWVINARTTFGYEMRAVGANAKAARFAGISVERVVLKTALLSGALAGLAGVGEVAGRAGYLTLDMSPGYGYSGIVIAMLAGLNPLGVVLAALFVGGVIVGADSMSRAIGVPTYLADVIVAVSLLTMLVTTMLARYRVRWT